MATDIFRGVDLNIYDIDVAPTMFTPTEAKAEFVRLARIANRRIKTIAESPDFGDSAKASHAAFSVKGLKTDRQIYAALQQVARFNAQKTSTLSGLRAAQAKQLATMRERGYTFLNKGNIKEFGDFWREVKKHAEYKKGGYDSERIANLFKEAKRKRIDAKDLAKDFKYWLDHEKELDTMKRSNSTITSDEAKERIS